MKNIKRNSLAVRLTDDDYNQFLDSTDDNYSLTLRELIKVYNKNYRPSDSQLPTSERVKTVLSRI